MKVGELFWPDLDYWAAMSDDTLHLKYDEEDRFESVRDKKKRRGEPRPRIRAEDWRPSISWSQGGPILERKRIAISFGVSEKNGELKEVCWAVGFDSEGKKEFRQQGSTVLIAAMRCVVACKFGEEVE